VAIGSNSEILAGSYLKFIVLRGAEPAPLATGETGRFSTSTPFLYVCEFWNLRKSSNTTKSAQKRGAIARKFRSR